MHEAKPKGILQRTVLGLMSMVAWLVVLIGVLWAFGALWFDFPIAHWQPWPAVVFAVVVLLVPAVLRAGWGARIVMSLMILAVLAWWLSIPPRQNRDWKQEVALSPFAKVEGDVLTFYNVRNFDYRTETDFTPRYEMRRVELKNLRGADLFITNWGSPFMAHPIVSYDFGVDGRICFSIETRPQKGQAYSAIGGLYRQFELFYVVADERDVIRVRTNYREGENVYLYRLQTPDLGRLRNSVMEYVRSVNDLRESPKWYNAITQNCTTAIRHQKTAAERSPWDWRLLANGYGDELLYERGAINHSLPFAELKKRSLINARAQAADQDPDFSAKIREGLPGM